MIELREEHAASIVSLYERHARDWDCERGRDLCERTWVEKFLALTPAQREVLDLGCGSGDPIGRYLIQQGSRLTGIDVANAMIGICKSKFPNQSWRVADMRSLSLGRTFHAILAWDSFFHLTRDDQRAMFPIFRVHSAPGTALMFTSGAEDGEALSAYHRQPLYHASLGADEYRDLLARNGFDVVSMIARDPDCDQHTVWLAKAR